MTLALKKTIKRGKCVQKNDSYRATGKVRVLLRW